MTEVRLQAERPEIRARLLEGQFGLEKESLRVDGRGFFAQTAHPFPGHRNIDRDFSENQIEINTPVYDSAGEAVDGLVEYTRQVQTELAGRGELLWPFSNPPYIRNERDIPIARYSGELASKTRYREYLSDKYGRYKMTFSGIHFNYSFSEELLRLNAAVLGVKDEEEYRSQFYVVLAERAAAYGWIMTALTAASPLGDTSFVKKGAFDRDLFQGMASVRSSELGYWNFFPPVFDYSDIWAYAEGIQKYVEEGFLVAPSELYYPIRLKPRGKNDLRVLHDQGVDHIELRMIDLNPLCPEGIDVRDAVFAQLLLVWLASTPRQPFAPKDQVEAVQNFMHAARYDLKTVKIVVPDGQVLTVTRAARDILGWMKEFYRDFPPEIQEVITFEEEKILEPEKRYAWQVKEKFGQGFVKKGLALAREYQEYYLNMAEKTERG